MSHAQLQPNQRVQVFKLDTIRLNPDYIPHPETFIKSKLDSLTDRMNQKLHQLKSIECPPFISQVYGDVRKELYLELEASMKDFSSTKRNEYKHKFYQEIDFKFQEKFQNMFNIRDKYHEFILIKGLALQNTTNEDSDSLKDDIGVSVDMLKTSIIDLTIDWFVAIDNIVDLLVRCHLYGIKGETIFQDLYSKAHKRWLKTSQISWTDRIFKGLKTSIDYLKNLVESRGCIEFALYTQDVAATDLFTLVSYLAYGDLIENYLKYLASNEHQGFLVKMKGFMLLLVQSMTSIAQQMYSQLDRCLSAASKKEKEKEELNLYSFLDQIVCLQDNVPFFDEDFIKGNIIKQLIV